MVEKLVPFTGVLGSTSAMGSVCNKYSSAEIDTRFDNLGLLIAQWKKA